MFLYKYFAARPEQRITWQTFWV